MTISLRGSATGLAAGTTTALAFTLPTGVTTNDLMLALIGTKPFGNTLASGTLTTDGWSAQSAGSNGSTANGIDTGSVWAVIYSKVHDGSEVAPTGTLGTTPSPRMSGMLAFQSTRTGSGWSVTSTNASDATATGSTLSATGAANLAVAAGDELVVLVVHKTDAATHTSPSLTLSGATITNLTQQFATTTTTSGNDGAMYVYSADVTAGATAAPVFTATIGGTNVSDAQVVFLRIREPQTASGLVAATSTSSGTVVGKEGHKGLVAATITSSAIVVASEHHSGTVTASTTSTGTVTGREGHKGTVSATLTSTGTVVRSEQHTGTVAGTITSTGTVVGIQADRGTVSATITASATAAGAKAASDAVTATITSTGVVVSSEHHFGQVTGSIISSATVTGYKPTDDRFGSASGVITSTGTAGPVPPAPPAPQPSGGHLVEFVRPRREPRRPRPVERKSGRVTALCVSTGRVTGLRASAAAASAATTLRCAIAASKQARALVLSDMTDHETRVTGTAGVRDSEYLALYAELRRTRDDHDLLMLL